MTAKPISWPMKVDIYCFPPGFTSTPRILLASVADRLSTDEYSSVWVAAPCCGQPVFGVLHGLGDLAACLGTLLVDDLAAGRTSLVADGRRFTARAGHLLVVVGLSRRELLGRLAVVGRRLGQHGFPCGEHLADRGHHPFPDHRERDQEDEQHCEEGAVGDQKVALSPPPSSAARIVVVSSVMLSDYDAPGVAKTNSAMKARLMK